MTPVPLVTLDDARRAQAALAGRVHRTPVSRSATLSALTGTNLHLKLELFQKTGSFKARGALNRIDELSAAERARGVVTISAGNHAAAVSWAARSVGAPATVVMPSKAAQSKVDATRGYGGTVILTDGDLLATALALKEERGLTMVHPFDDRGVIAGAATLGLEIAEDLADADVVLVGCGGGGVLSGIAVAVRALNPACRIVGVEPEGAPAMRLSLDRGSPQRIETIDTIADGLAAPFAGNLTFEHVLRLNLEIVTVTDAAIVEAMWLLIERCKVTAEPAAAAGLAALLSGRVAVEPGAKVVCVVTGGNIDRTRLRALA